MIAQPYLVFLGDMSDELYAKTAFGLRDWLPGACIGQVRQRGCTLAGSRGRQLHDVRHCNRSFPVGTGRKRSGKRLLTVGTDCAVGKKYTALAIARELRARGINADFRATGQTGILIAARLTNPRARFVGIALNTSKLSATDSAAQVRATADRLGLPCVDPIRTGVAAIVGVLAC